MTHPAETVSVVIVDDRPTFRSIARTVVALASGFEVVAEADTGEGGVDETLAHRADLVLMDVNLPGIDGGEATRRIVAALPRTVVVLMSSYAIEDLPVDVAEVGAAAYVHKEHLEPAVLADLWLEHGRRTDV